MKNILLLCTMLFAFVNPKVVHGANEKDEIGIIDNSITQFLLKEIDYSKIKPINISIDVLKKYTNKYTNNKSERENLLEIINSGKYSDNFIAFEKTNFVFFDSIVNKKIEKLEGKSDIPDSTYKIVYSGIGTNGDLISVDVILMNLDKKGYRIFASFQNLLQ
ncbi:MAG TPA: hypothetical protein VLZ75_08485 [Chitinophagales bacterium]|nr:hypothetical protein [Chitinophagales bacterium]